MTILSKKGLTLIELLAILAIIGVIATIATVTIGRMIENTRLKADHANAMMLNEATRLFKITYPKRTDFNQPQIDNETLIELLYTERFISKNVKPSLKDGVFIWNRDIQLWLYKDQYIISSSDGLNYDSDFYMGQGRLIGPYTGSSASIVIPDIIDGSVIVRIWQDAFRYDSNPESFSNTQLISVIFTSGSQLEVIHARAFQNNNLTEIIFPNSLKEIHLRAFFGNPNLTKITIGPHVTKIEDNVFLGNNAFRDAYELGGEGTYIYMSGVWVKQ
jgi:prepilin-type N-terminal cleavage/methylation domain-containing protein